MTGTADLDPAPGGVGSGVAPAPTPDGTRQATRDTRHTTRDRRDETRHPTQQREGMMSNTMDMSDPAVQDMLEQDKQEALARIRAKDDAKPEFLNRESTR